MDAPIILISGGTGVGTSTFSIELAKALNIHTAISTDSIREIIRSTLNQDVNPALKQSTYLAGQTKNYRTKKIDVRKAEILRGYKMQCETVNIGSRGMIQRAIEENTPLILEGIHIMPGKVNDPKIYGNDTQRFVEYHFFISDKQIHKKHFEQRQKNSPERKISKYLENFEEIRWIHDYLGERANKYENILKIENKKDIELTLDEMINFFNLRMTKIK